MSVKERMESALRGGTPDKTPLSVHDMMIDDLQSDRWTRLFEKGLGINRNVPALSLRQHGVSYRGEHTQKDGKKYYTQYVETPAGRLRQQFTNGWQTEHLLKEPGDYLIMKWIMDHTEVSPAYETLTEHERQLGDRGVIIASRALLSTDDSEDVMVDTLRSPAMKVNVDYAGVGKFCLDIAMEVEELHALLESMKRVFNDICAVLADAPCTFVKFFENMSIDMLGPDHYARLLHDVYKDTFVQLQKNDKQIALHFDGKLKVIKDLIADEPFDILESLTEPPEGDMQYDECRAAWPQKAFWANIADSDYTKPKEELQQLVKSKRERAGKRALAFEISENLPHNWEESIPVVLDTLENLE